METNLLLNFSNVFNYNLTMCCKEIFDENSVFDEFNNIVGWIKAFLKYDDKYQAFTNFVKNSQYRFCDDFVCQYEMTIDFKRKTASLFKRDGNKTSLINKENFQAA